MNLLPLAAVAGVFFLFSQKKKTTSLKSSKPLDKNPSDNVPSDDYGEDFPDSVNKELNSKNIEPYFMIKPYTLPEIPYIFDDLTPAIQKVYQTPAYSQAFLYIDKEFAGEVWEYAKFLADKGIIKDGILIRPVTDAQAGVFAKEILQKLAPNVYWADGLAPYAYESEFYYVWASVSFLAKLAWSQIRSSKGDTIGLVLPKSIV